MEFPEWWEWELDFSDHALDQMQLRGISEIEVRGMLGRVLTIDEDNEPDRWRISCRFKRRSWIVIVEPSHDEQKTVVVTAFPRSPRR
jgi:hypothetical protein